MHNTSHVRFSIADDMSAQNSNEEVPIAGINSILPKEHGNKFYTLQILQHLEKDVCAIVSWDSSLHDSQALNRVTEGKHFFRLHVFVFA